MSFLTTDHAEHKNSIVNPSGPGAFPWGSDLIAFQISSSKKGALSGAMLIPTNTYGDRAPFSSVGGGERTKSGSRWYTRAILPSFGPHGCVKPYCCLFVCIGFLLRSDGRCQTERESVPGVE